MAVNEMVKKAREDRKATDANPSILSSPLSRYGYRELPGLGENRMDVLDQLKANLSQIEDLHGKLKFMMTEIQGLVKRR